MFSTTHPWGLGTLTIWPEWVKSGRRITITGPRSPPENSLAGASGWYREDSLAGASGWYREDSLAGASGWYRVNSLAGASGWYREDSLAGASGWYREDSLAGASGWYRVNPLAGASGWYRAVELGMLLKRDATALQVARLAGMIPPVGCLTETAASRIRG